jgi:hypothetical protein
VAEGETENFPIGQSAQYPAPAAYFPTSHGGVTMQAPSNAKNPALHSQIHEISKASFTSGFLLLDTT